ncbi:MULTISPECIES: phage tail tube protein [unclassified Acinetobacter]|uniref:phage tail tube protein n=1 Tax=unclassified Acinetobacter TaxID=196816 RepID=UPI00293451BE|nr:MULTISPECIES: phage tail tube protein [unclassified Acinetobacter]WOE32749.1 phage tail tube protein [Acinetobacter sp. SAAs470]WOE38226.1 phage tail tube protein [Acinetobacter sp. SAAs474]
MSSGAKQTSAYGVESAPGVIATTWKTLPFTTNSLDAAAQTTESQTIKDSRIAAGTLVTGVEVTGDVETEFAYDIQDSLLEGVAFNQWVNNVLTFGGDTRKTFSIIRGFKDIENYQVFTGCHINQWTLSIPDGGIVTSKFSIMGMKRTAYMVSPATTVTPAEDATQFTSLSTGDILIDGEVKAGMCITQLDLTIDNSMQMQKCLNYENNISAILETIMKGTGTFTVAWSKNTAEFYEKQFLNESISLQYSIKDSDGNKYTLKLPNLKITAPLPSGSMGDILNTQFTFTVADQAPTLTRVPVVAGP